jgi:hypothetical protein
VEKRKKPKRSPANDATQQSPDDRRLDASTILNDTAHTPDRDQSFAIDHKTFPSAKASIYDDSWEGDTEERMLGDRFSAKDALTEMEDIGRITEPQAKRQGPRETPTTAPRTDDEEKDISLLNDDQLHALAEALSIAGRSQMRRTDLIEAIRRGGTSA